MLFPILGSRHPGVRRAMAEHRRLQRLINGRTDAVMAVSLVEEELEAHIRFEERQLFAQIQNVATPQQLMDAQLAHEALQPVSFPDGVEDVFWK